MREYDLGFIVPLNEEFRVLEELCPVIDSEVHNAIHYYTLELPDSNYRAVAVVLGDMGTTRASQVTEKVLNYVKLKAIVLLGIAGALDEDLKLGDVVVANEINEFQTASKALRKGETSVLQYSGGHWRTSFTFTQCARSFEFSDKDLYGAWRNQVKDFRNGLGLSPEQLLLANDFPEIRVGHIASGDAVVASKAYAIELRGIDRKFVALEMEAAGIAQAAYARGEPVPIMVIRGVSDFAAERKEELDSAGDGVWRKYAMYSASAFLLNLLKAKSFQEIIFVSRRGQVLLNKYKILKPLGSGALGDVYLAEDMALRRLVAVKHLKPEYAADEQALGRFREEASTIANLRHPNIAIVYGLEREDGQSYIIMEYAEKGTLADLLGKKGPLPITQAIGLTIALCYALTAVHERGIFHRDIRPSNILLIESEDIAMPRLTDFGLSSASKGSDVYSGILEYAPPEQLREDPVDARSDIYSLGVILYEMLIGRPPFTGSPDEILRAQLEQEPLSPRSARKEILPSLEKVVLKALSKKPEDRYQRTREMVQDLEMAYQDAASRAKEAERHARSQILYAEGMEFLNQREWGRAIDRFEEIRRSDPGYEDVDARLAEAERQKGWQHLYDEGLACHGQKDWQEAIEKFTQLLSENPEYPTAVVLLEEAKRQQTEKETRAKRSEENPIKVWWSSQEPTVKAAWIGAIATLLTALIGLLGGDITLEIVKYLRGPEGNVLGVIFLIGFALFILGPIVLSLPIRRVHTRRGRDAWEQNIQELLLEGESVDPQMLNGLPRKTATSILQEYPRRHPEQDLVYIDSAQRLAFHNQARLEAFASRWAQALDAISNNESERFRLQVTAVTDALCETLGFTRLRSPAPYKHLFGIMVKTPTIRLGMPPTFPFIYLYRHQFSSEDIEGLRNMMIVLDECKFALIVTFDNAQAVQQMLDRHPILPVHGYNFAVLDKPRIQRILTAKNPERVFVQAILERVDLTVISPFSTEGPAPENMFFGRDRELKEIETKLADVSLALVGNRRIGKTSIMRRIQRTLEVKDQAVFFLDCHAASDHEDFFRLINMDKEWQLDGLRITDYSPLSFAALITPLSKDGSPVIVLLDEVDCLLDYDKDQDWALTRTFRTLSQTGRCRFLFTGIETLYKQKHNPDCPLYNFCNMLTIKYLRRQDAERLIVEPMNLMGIELENERELLNRILDTSMAHPSIIQWICAALIKDISEKGDRRITLRHIDATCQSSKFQDYFAETIVGKATYLERIIAYILEEKTYTSSQILHELSVHGITPTYTELSEALDHLELYSILQKADKRYGFPANGFPRMIREALDVEIEIETLKEKLNAQGILPN